MRSLVCLTVAVVVAVGAMTILTWAAPNPSLAINFHFVPPLLSARCNMSLQSWQPPNMRCANCFCLTGTVSRCVPMTGCNPNLPTDSSSTTVDPNAPTMEPTSMSPEQANPVEQMTTPASTAATTTTAAAAANTTTAAPSG